MCGIAGVVNYKEDISNDYYIIKRLCLQQKYTLCQLCNFTKNLNIELSRMM